MGTTGITTTTTRCGETAAEACMATTTTTTTSTTTSTETTSTACTATGEASHTTASTNSTLSTSSGRTTTRQPPLRMRQRAVHDLLQGHQEPPQEEGQDVPGRMWRSQRCPELHMERVDERHQRRLLLPMPRQQGYDRHV